MSSEDESPSSGAEEDAHDSSQSWMMCQVCSNRMIHKTQHKNALCTCTTCILSTLNITKQMHCLLLVHCVHVQGMHMYIHTDKEKYDCVIAQIAHQNIHIHVTNLV